MGSYLLPILLLCLANVLTAADERPKALAAPTGENAVDRDEPIVVTLGPPRDGVQRAIMDEVAANSVVTGFKVDEPARSRPGEMDAYDDNFVDLREEQPIFIPRPYRNETTKSPLTSQRPIGRTMAPVPIVTQPPQIQVTQPSPFQPQRPQLPPQSRPVQVVRPQPQPQPGLQPRPTPFTQPQPQRQPQQRPLVRPQPQPIPQPRPTQPPQSVLLPQAPHPQSQPTSVTSSAQQPQPQQPVVAPQPPTTASTEQTTAPNRPSVTDRPGRQRQQQQQVQQQKQQRIQQTLQQQQLQPQLPQKHKISKQKQLPPTHHQHQSQQLQQLQQQHKQLQELQQRLQRQQQQLQQQRLKQQQELQLLLQHRQQLLQQHQQLQQQTLQRPHPQPPFAPPRQVVQQPQPQSLHRTFAPLRHIPQQSAPTSQPNQPLQSFARRPGPPEAPPRIMLPPPQEQQQPETIAPTLAPVPQIPQQPIRPRPQPPHAPPRVVVPPQTTGPAVAQNLRTGVCHASIFYISSPLPPQSRLTFTHFAVAVSVDQCARTCHEFNCAIAHYDPSNGHCQFNPSTAFAVREGQCPRWPAIHYRNNVVTAEAIRIFCVQCHRPFRRGRGRNRGGRFRTRVLQTQFTGRIPTTLRNAVVARSAKRSSEPIILDDSDASIMQGRLVPQQQSAIVNTEELTSNRDDREFENNGNDDAVHIKDLKHQMTAIRQNASTKHKRELHSSKATREQSSVALTADD